MKNYLIHVLEKEHNDRIIMTASFKAHELSPAETKAVCDSLAETVNLITNKDFVIQFMVETEKKKKK